jgi:hypothetical protein
MIEWVSDKLSYGISEWVGELVIVENGEYMSKWVNKWVNE